MAALDRRIERIEKLTIMFCPIGVMIALTLGGFCAVGAQLVARSAKLGRLT